MSSCGAWPCTFSSESDVIAHYCGLSLGSHKKQPRGSKKLKGPGHLLSPQIWDGVLGLDSGHWSLSPIEGMSSAFCPWLWTSVIIIIFFLLSGEGFSVGHTEQRKWVMGSVFVVG